MIPKIVHYCWFGHNPLPASALKCIASWRRFLPDYEIKEWNEDNFDVNIIPYTQQAYAAKKYAFVSDYARFWILYKYGGVYFDTDVEVIKPMDDIIARGPFMGIECNGNRKDKSVAINPGLGLGATSGMEIYRKIIEQFHQMEFYANDGSICSYTMIPMITLLYSEKGFKANGEVEYVANTFIYPQDYFNPFDDLTGKLNTTTNTYSIHWYSKTWINASQRQIWLSRLVHRLFGLRIHRLKSFLKGMHK